MYIQLIISYYDLLSIKILNIEKDLNAVFFLNKQSRTLKFYNMYVNIVFKLQMKWKLYNLPSTYLLTDSSVRIMLLYSTLSLSPGSGLVII